MFSLSKKNKNTEEQLVSSFRDDGVARIAVREDGSILYVSPAFLALTGGVNVRSLHDVIDEAAAAGSMAAGIYAIRAGAHGRADFHFDWITAPDRQRYLIGSHVDAPERRRDASDLGEFYDLSPDLMLITNLSYDIVQANHAFEILYGSRAGAEKAVNFIDLFHPDDKPYIRNTIQTINFDNPAAADMCMDFEARILPPDAAPRHIEWRQCRRGGKIYYSGRDVTSIKQQKEALDRRARELQQAESIGRMGHWHWTLGQDAIEWSDELYRIFGVGRDFRPTLESMAQLVHKRDMARVNQAFQRAIIEENDYDMEFRVLHPDGDFRYVHCEGRCAVNETGEVVALYGIMQDMTERMLYERDLREAKEAAERANAAKSQFLANMSHELRTPLNAVIGFSDIMLKELLGPIGSEKYKEYIDGIHKSGEHLLDLISDILDMSKMEAGKYALDLETVNLGKTIRHAAHMIEGKALDEGVKIVIDPSVDESTKIVADRRAVMQIILNLLSNAVKFSKADGRVDVNMQRRGDAIVIKVSDNGIGIPANKLASITRPFEQAFPHYTRAHEGSGLGLAITKELVELHGGSLHIDSTLDVGTAVSVRLPMKVKN